MWGKKKKYEFKIVASKEEYLNERTKEAYVKGWEVAGDCLIKNNGHYVDEATIYVPFRREIK